ncbi:WGR domain-containing protein [Defluviimonas salinarum]|uniref:WGR domain-containing protein n=1 Tax=Defluviimonas salinarum TaxID=2992147 RepID=A0ABT3J498_9RHOB|nr:WGR domain-containing protein [Defluviimonas salinarum]MCW3782509.1 WGR domain-containing protein [Defluviimonas salinarum]
MTEPKAINLYFREGGSDKIYQAQLVEAGGGWRVTFQYGRRGKPLTAGEKTDGPTTYEKAEKIYDKLVASKVAKGC